jgi:hypothetical protein
LQPLVGQLGIDVAADPIGPQLIAGFDVSRRMA